MALGHWSASADIQSSPHLSSRSACLCTSLQGAVAPLHHCLVSLNGGVWAGGSKEESGAIGWDPSSMQWQQQTSM